MKISKELMNKAKGAKSAEELFALAKENGVDVSQEEVKRFFEKQPGTGALADEELDNVAGGGLCDPDYERPAAVEIGRAADGAAVCPQCMGGLSYGTNQEDPAGDKYDPVSCYKCGLHFRHYWIGDSWTEG